MFRNGVADHATKELCRVYVSRSVLCEFCGNQRSIKAAKAGTVEDDYMDLINFESSTRYSDKQKAALAYAEMITWDLPATDAVWERLHKHFSEPELVEIGYFIAITMGQQRWLRTLNIEHHQVLAGQDGSMAPGLRDNGRTEGLQGAGRLLGEEACAAADRGGGVVAPLSMDDLVKSAIAHWAPRFVANGVALTDFEEVTAGIASWNDWCRAWSEKAAVHEAMGREALAAKKFISAGEHLQRAGVYYHFGKFLFVHDVPQMKAAHMKAVACRNLALPHLNPPGERVTIPYEGRALYGILRKPNGVAKPPVLIMAVGLDSAKEETDAYERPYLDRGIATLVFDGPGQGEGEYDFGDPRRLRGGREGGGGLRRDPTRSRYVAHRAVGRQPRRILRAARGGLREAHQGLHCARRSVRLGR